MQYFMFSYGSTQHTTIIYFAEYCYENLELFRGLVNSGNPQYRLYEKQLDETYVDTFMSMPILNTRAYKFSGKLQKRLPGLEKDEKIKERIWVDVCNSCWQDKNDEYGTQSTMLTDWLKFNGLKTEKHNCDLLFTPETNRGIIVD